VAVEYREIGDVENEIRSTKELLESYFGEQNEYFTLYKTCVSTDTVEYTYELCLFEEMRQKPRHGGSSTSLGKYSKDENIDWKEGKTNTMHYTGGQKCWGGPDRSTKVEILCDKENRIVDVAEPNKCEYSIKWYTPAICHKGHLQNVQTQLLEQFSGEVL